MRHRITKYRDAGLAMLVMTLSIVGMAYAQDPGKGATSYLPVDIKEDFASTMARLKAEKPDVEKKHKDLLNKRYDLSNRPVKGVTMSRGKAVQEGVRVNLKGTTWEKLAATSPGDQGKRSVSRGLLPSSAPEAFRGRHALSEIFN